jgi:hypothetical protein
MRIQCRTLFDCSYTGVTGHFRISELPFEDHAGQTVADQAAWHHSRNQQRNWETLTQILGLRTQLFALTTPVKDTTGTRWMFEFATESAGVYGPDSDPVSVLRSDAEAVPMLCGLGNTPDLDPYLVTTGDRQNIWFAPVTINI